MPKTEEQFIAAYDRFAPAILRHIFYRVSDQALAEDLTQETFFKAWRNISSGEKNVENYKAFFYRIANNLIIDHYRQKDKKPSSIEDVNEIEISYDPTQEKEMEHKINIEIVEEKLKELGEEYRDILIMRYVDDLSVKEISSITGKTPNSVSVIIHRGVKMLKNKIYV